MSGSSSGFIWAARCSADRPEASQLGEEEPTVAMIESKDRATSDPEARKAVLRAIEKEGVEYFLFRDNATTVTLDEGGYFAMTALDAATELRNETIRALESMGIGIEYHHHEVAPSQHEIDMRYSSALDMADQTITYRLVVKEVAAKNGVYATFMPKPLFGENGSGMHTHQSLFTEGRNAFFDAEDEWHLSATGKAFIAGQLRHAREISAVFAQWVNSYKRLVPGFEAP